MDKVDSGIHSNFLFNVLALAIAYYLFGKLGLYFSIEPEFATPIFPAAGIAVAAVLIGGNRYCLGILIGSLVLNVQNSSLAFDNSLILAIIISISSTLQAVFGAYLVRLVDVYPNRLDSLRSICTTIIFAGPIACLLTATIAVFYISIFMIPGGQTFALYFFKWCIWWVGDSIGVILLLPIMIFLFSQKGWIERIRRYLVIITLTILTLIMMMLFKYIDNHNQGDIKSSFINHANAEYQTISTRLNNAYDILNAVKSFFLSSERVTQDEYEEFVSHIIGDREVIQAVEWVPKIDYQSISKYEEIARQDGMKPFQITQLNSSLNIVKAEKRDVYYPVFFVYPLDSNKKVYGFDIASNEMRKKSITLAIDAGGITATRKIKLVQGQVGFLLLNPVYNKNSDIEEISQRRKNIFGMVVGVMNLEGLIGQNIKNSRYLTVNLLDEGVYNNIFDGSKKTYGLLSLKKRFDFYGHNWVLVFHPTMIFFADFFLKHILLEIIVCYTFVLLSVIFILITTGRTETVFRLVDGKTREIEKNQKRLQETTSSYRSMFQAAADAIITINDKGFVSSANKSAMKMFGIFEPKTNKTHIQSLFSVKNHEVISRGMSALKKEETYPNRFNEEVEIVNVKGNITPAELSIGIFYKDSGSHYTFIIRDITDRIAQKRELEESREKLQAILDSSYLSIIATKLDGTIIVFNKAAERMLGYKASEIVNITTPAIIHKESEVVEYAKKLTELLDRKVEPGFDTFIAKLSIVPADEKEWTYITKDGVEIPVMLSITSLKDEKGMPFGYLGIAQDISERKKVDKLKREFVSVVSHELRTPLTSILGALGIVLGGVTGSISDKTKELLIMANNNCERLVQIINDILDIDKIDAGKAEFKLRIIDVNEPVYDAINLNHGYAEKFSVKIVSDIKAKNSLVNVDESKLIQALTNLISNALKFSPASSEVLVRTEDISDHVRISITDRGKGIPDDFKEKIFEKFTQVDSSPTRSTAGSGLGLSITKSIIENMNGIISFESKVGEGTTFFIDLPIASKDEE